MKIGIGKTLILFFAMVWLFFGHLAVWSYMDGFDWWYAFLIFPLGANLLFANLYYGWVTFD